VRAPQDVRTFFKKERNMLNFDMTEISAILNDINLITKVKFDLYDENFNILHGENQNMCDFCKLVRECPDCHKKCIESDRKGFLMSQKTARAYTYKCHMGLSEIITPIVENGVIIGYMMIGQILMEGDSDKVRELIDLAGEKYGVDKNALLSELDKINLSSRDFLESAIGVLSMCICYLYTNNIIVKRDGGLGAKLRKYIDFHIDGDLAVETLCKMLYVSKSKLYAVSRSEFGMGISDYIQEQRMKKAKKLLRETDNMISAIAASVGYADANYFTRAFKRETGMTPKKYRAQKTVE
jgi:AraC-like DNA-binding protein